MKKWLTRILILLLIAGCYGGYRFYKQKDYEAKQAVLQQFATEQDKKDKEEKEKQEEIKRREEAEKQKLEAEKAKKEAEQKEKVKPVPIDKCYEYDPTVDDARLLPPIKEEVVALFKDLINMHMIVPMGKSELYGSPGTWRVKVSPYKKDAEYYVLRFYNELPGHHSKDFYDVYAIRRKNERYIYIDITVEGKTGNVAGYHVSTFEINKEAGINGKYNTIEKVVY